MSSQYVCYPNTLQGCNSGKGTYGAAGCVPKQGYRQGSRGTNFQQNNARSNCGGYGSNSRAPPVFPSAQESAKFYAQSSGKQQQSTSWGGSCASPRQGVGRSNQFPPSAVNKLQKQQRPSVRRNPPPPNPQSNIRVPMAPPSTLNPPQFCTPQAIKVNITAEQLQNAQKTPIYQDRGEPGLSENGNVKYIQLNWQDLLGGMENMRVSMMPSSDPCNDNRQLKVSFGGQKTDPPQAGETALKVLSISPAAVTERMELQQGNAFAGTMKVCNTPRTNLTIAPSPSSSNNGYYQQGQSQQQQQSYRAACRHCR